MLIVTEYSNSTICALVHGVELIELMNARQARTVYRYESIKDKLRTNAPVFFNKIMHIAKGIKLTPVSARIAHVTGF